MRGTKLEMYENINVETVAIDVITSCNLNCIHCYNRKDDDIGNMCYESILMIVDKFSIYGVSEIIISGGEPLMHPDIDSIMRMPLSYPKINFTIATNCMLFSENLSVCAEQIDNLTIQISMDGSSAEIYEKQRGIGSYDAFTKGFLLLAQSSIRRKSAKIAVSRINYRDVENVYRLLVEHGICPSFQFVDNVGNAKDNWECLSLSLAQKMHVINTIKKMNTQYDKEIPIPVPAPSCVFSEFQERKTFLVGADGSVTVCQWLCDYPIGNILHESLPDILRNEKMMYLYEMGSKRYDALKMSSTCVSCGIRWNCPLGCLGMALSNGDEYGYDGECAFRKAETAFKFLNHNNG